MTQHPRSALIYRSDIPIYTITVYLTKMSTLQTDDTVSVRERERERERVGTSENAEKDSKYETSSKDASPTSSVVQIG